MKKRLLSVLLVLCMVCTFLPASVLAATPTDHAIKLELVKDNTTFSGKDVLRVDFMYKSGSTDTPTNQMVYLKFDASKLAPLYNEDGSDVSSNLTNFSTNYGESLSKNNYKTSGFGGGDSEVVIYAVINSGTGYINWKITEKGSPAPFTDFTRISSIFFGLKGGVTFDAMPKDVIKLATVAEDASITAQTVSVEVTTNSSDILSYGTSSGTDTLTVNVNELFVAGVGVTFVEPPKPAYSGDIAAPTVNSNAGGKVVLDAAVLTPADSSAKIQYGYSKTNDGKNITWQNSTTFSSLNVGETYYFYAKVEGTSSYAEKVSAASVAVPVADKALTNLEITTQPSTKTYTHGDTFKTDGMKVKATYNDGSSDTNFTGYTVAYETSGKNYLCKDNTKVTLKAGDKSVEVTSLTVNAKELTVTGLTAVEREYKPGDTSVTLSGGTLSGVVPGETVTLNTPYPAATVEDDKVADNKAVTISSKLTLSGDDAGNYTLTQPTGIKVNITPKNINGANITLNTAPTYDGTEKQVTISGVTVDGSPLNTGDYDIAAGTDKAINVESKELKITGKGNYGGEARADWKLQQATPVAADFDIPGSSAPLDYNGDPISVTPPTLKTGKTGAGTVTVYYTGTSGTTYSKSTTAPTNVGTYDVTFDVAEGTNYNAASDLTYGPLTIQAKDVSGLTAVIGNQTTAKGEGQFVDPVIKGVKGETLEGTLTYAYDSETDKTHAEVVTMLATKDTDDAVDLTYTFTPNSDNYTSTKTGTFKVTVKDIAFTVDNGSPADASNAITELISDTTYGATWNERISLNPITAKVGTDIKEGTFTIVPDSGNLTDRPGVSASGYTVKFSSDDNAYTDVTVFNGSITVTPREVTVSGITANSKPYDSNNTATVDTTNATFPELVSGDTLNISVTSATFDDPNVGENKTVTLTLGSLSGASATNYTLDTANSQSEATADITARTLSITDAAVSNKPYDGNTTATVTDVTFGNLVVGESLTVGTDYTVSGVFNSADAATDRTVTVTVTLNDTVKNYALPTATFAKTGVSINKIDHPIGKNTRSLCWYS